MVKRIAIGVFGALALIMVVGGALLAAASRDIAPTHATLADADLPPLISVRSFYGDMESTWEYRPSAQGKYYAHYGSVWATDTLFIRDLATGEEVLTIEDPRWFEWSDIPEILHVYRNDRLWKVDVTRAYETSWEDITPRGFSSWNLVSAPSYEVGKRWVMTWDRSGEVADLWQIDIDGQNRELIEQNDGMTLGWVGTRTLDLAVRTRRPDPNTTLVEVADAGSWRDLTSFGVDEDFSVVAVDPDAGHLTAFSNRGRDTLALVSMSLEDGSETVLADHPDYDLGRSFEFGDAYTDMDFVVTDVDETIQFALNEDGRAFKELYDAQGARADLEDVYVSPDGRTVIAQLAPDAIGYRYMHFDLDAGTSREIDQFSFYRRHAEDLVSTGEVRFEARDGLELHGFLLRPKGVEGPVPTLISIHGGPANNRSWGYRHWRQLLANRGYAVLSVNFRGSTGYGKDFQAAGYGEFGRAMQHDIEDAALWAVEQGIADRDALGVIGGSYGGYSAAMAALQRPDLFKAAIVEHAMLDVAYQSQFPPPSWGLNQHIWTNYFGDPDSDADLDIMRAFSPVTLAASLEVPMLMIAGKRDRVVGFEQTERFEDIARDAPTPPEVLIFDNEGHGVRRWQNRVTRARAVEDFLAEHLGGRSGGWDWIEAAAERF